MPTTPPPDLDALLRGVSRSFYLSIRLLPRPLRRPVGLAYLLARATDTVADTAALPAQERLDLLARLGGAIQQAEPDPGWNARAATFAQAQHDSQERTLILHVGHALAALQRLDSADRAEVQQVLRHIVQGQALDLQRFPGGGPVQALPDAAALHAYTYLVAGCVGEFWTRLVLRHQPGHAARPAAEMLSLGRAFGCGLQLVNIVRDAGVDLAAGRCYFPADELAAVGLGPAEILAAPERFAPVWHRWQAAAAAGMDDGLAYALAVNPRRARAAVALPALLGVRTLALLHAAGPQALARRVKVPRREVHALMARMLVTMASRDALRAQFTRMRRWDNPAQ